MSIYFDNPATIEQLNLFDLYVSPTPLEHRIARFRDIIEYQETWFRCMNWNLDVMKYFMRDGKFKRPTHKEALWAIPGCFY